MRLILLCVCLALAAAHKHLLLTTTTMVPTTTWTSTSSSTSSSTSTSAISSSSTMSLGSSSSSSTSSSVTIPSTDFGSSSSSSTSTSSSSTMDLFNVTGAAFDGLVLVLFFTADVGSFDSHIMEFGTGSGKYYNLSYTPVYTIVGSVVRVELGVSDYEAITDGGFVYFYANSHLAMSVMGELVKEEHFAIKIGNFPGSSSSAGSSELTGGGIAGVVIGSVAAAALLLAVAFLVNRRKKKKRTGSFQPNEFETSYTSTKIYDTADPNYMGAPHYGIPPAPVLMKHNSTSTNPDYKTQINLEWDPVVYDRPTQDDLSGEVVV